MAVIISTASGYAQLDSSEKAGGWDRWALKANAFEIFATIPNVGVEFDVSRSPLNRITVSLSAKYNWISRQNPPSAAFLKLFEFRNECRYWFRPTPEEGVKKTGAFYAGAYVHAGQYSAKLWKTGHEGPLMGIGGSYGYSFPMYTYRKFALDFEVGIAAGLAITESTAFRMKDDKTGFARISENASGWKVVPYPVISELRAAFVFRKTSIRERFLKTDTAKIIRRQEKQDERNARKQAKAEERALKRQMNDQ